MVAERHESSTSSLIASDLGLDPNSAEFIAACLAISNRIAARPEATPAAEHDQNSARESAPDEVAAPGSHLRRALAEALEHQSGETSPGGHVEPDPSAEDELRGELAVLREKLADVEEELVNVTGERDETITAVKVALNRAHHDRAKLETAMRVISDRDSTIEQLRQNMAERDLEISDLDRRITEREREIDELQQHVLQVEEARVADATAILDSLDKYRT